MENIFDQLREHLQPSGGTLNVVGLRPTAASYYKHEFVLEVIAHLERQVWLSQTVGPEMFTPSDKLALWFLLDAAGIDFKTD